MTTPARREQRRLLGLRRAVRYTMAGAPPAPIRSPAAVKAGTTPDAISRAIVSVDAERALARLVGDVCDALYPETRACR
jgi:hypothetical protein